MKGVKAFLFLKKWKNYVKDKSEKVPKCPCQKKSKKVKKKENEDIDTGGKEW